MKSDREWVEGGGWWVVRKKKKKDERRLPPRAKGRDEEGIESSAERARTAS